MQHCDFPLLIIYLRIPERVNDIEAPVVVRLESNRV
jgi:hypothetical protein